MTIGEEVSPAPDSYGPPETVGMSQSFISTARRKGEDNCSVLVDASNCCERWRTLIKPGVTNHLDSDKKARSHTRNIFFLFFLNVDYAALTPG